MSDTEKRDKAADGGLRTTGLFCPLGPMANAESFGECLARHNIVDAHALDDPEGYDGYQTLERIGEAYDEITRHLTARAEEALQKVKDVMEDIQSRQNAKGMAGDEIALPSPPCSADSESPNLVEQPKQHC